jgi:hypothetical protein
MISGIRSNLMARYLWLAAVFFILRHLEFMILIPSPF